LESDVAGGDGNRIRERLQKSNLAPFLAVLGPGIIVSMVDNDAGGIAT